VSSSTSSSKKLARTWLFATLGLGVGALGALALFNYWVDPFAKRDTHSAKFDREWKNRTQNVAMWTLFEVAKLPAEACAEAEVIILGDSRARLLTKDLEGFRLIDLGGKKVVNLCVGGSTLEENMSFFEVERRRCGGFPKLEHIIFTAPLNRFTEPDRPDRIEQSLPMRKNPLIYYTSGFTLKRSIVSLPAIWKEPAKQGPGTAATGARVLKKWIRTYESYSPQVAAARLEKVRTFSAGLRKDGITVQFFMPPGQGSTAAVVAEAGLTTARQKIISTLMSIGTVTDMADATEIGGVAFNYLDEDPIHHDKGTQVLEFLLGRFAASQ
jgi:hypothetical protein